MKKIKRLMSGMFLLCFSFLLAGCLCDKKETYNVDFIVDNEVISTKEIQEGDKASAPVNPTKTGYDFVGWYIGETKFDFSTKINEELDLVAKFELAEYNLTIDLMGGQIEGNFPITSTYTIEDKVTLPTPTKDNFIFLGWQESGSAAVLATVVLDGATGNKSYTAIYEYADHRIPLYIDGILYKSVPVALGYKIMDLVENLDDTTLGWFKDEALYDAVLDNDVITENMKLYTKKYNGEDNSIFLVYEGFVKVNADSSWNGVIPKKIRGQVIKGIKEVNVSQTTKIYLPNSVTFINSSCLSDDGEFGNLPNTIASIGNVNVKVNSVSSIEIRKENISIEGYTFHNMTNLEQIEFENNSMLETIGNNAFYNAIFLKTITIPASVKSIGDYAFSNSSLSSIEFENNSMLETIGVFAFNGTQIDTITIPASVKTIGDDAFYNSSLSSIEFENNSMLEIIGDFSFRCTQLDTITIPASVKTIGDYAFSHSSLSSIEFENNSKLETIGDYAFSETQLETITIPASVKIIGNRTFGSRLSSIEFENNSKLETIGDYAFYNVIFLKTITIPASVKTIGNRAFYNSSLSSIEFENNSKLETIGDYAFRYSQLETITIPASVKTIGYEAFKSLILKNVIFESGSELEKIGDNAFYDTNIETIIIPLNVQEMGINSFDDNTIVVINYQNIYELIDNNLSNVQQIHVLKTLTGTNIYLEENYNKTETEDYWIYTRNA